VAPFTSINFYLLASIYLALVIVFKLILHNKHYSTFTFIFTLLYLCLYIKLGFSCIIYVVFSYFFIKHLSLKINHRLVSSIILLLPMLLFKLKVEIPFLYFIGLSFVTLERYKLTSITIQKKNSNLWISLIFYFTFQPY